MLYENNLRRSKAMLLFLLFMCKAIVSKMFSKTNYTHAVSCSLYAVL